MKCHLCEIVCVLKCVQNEPLESGVKLWNSDLREPFFSWSSVSLLGHSVINV